MRISAVVSDIEGKYYIMHKTKNTYFKEESLIKNP